MKMFVFGSSILSSYWNGAATYYRGCYKYLARLGYEITFAEPDAYGRQQHRDNEDVSYVNSIVYKPRRDDGGRDLERLLALARDHDVVIKHSGIGCDDSELERRVPDECGLNAMTFFWDVDAPATISRMRTDKSESLILAIQNYDAILTYGGGPKAREGYLQFGARAYYSIYNAVDPDVHHLVPPDPDLICDVAFIGNRLPDREARVEELFLGAAKLAPNHSFVLGGEGWADKVLPSNVRYIGHVPTADHNRVNCSASMVMNINRSSMAEFGFSPPTRVFEVSGTGTCLLCDVWPGMDDCFVPGEEILIVKNGEDVARTLQAYDAAARNRIGEAFRRRALRDHTYSIRAAQADFVFRECSARRRGDVGPQAYSAATLSQWKDVPGFVYQAKPSHEEMFA